MPPLTHLQFFVVSQLFHCDSFGAEIRQRLQEELDYKTSLPSFYQLMSRLESLGAVKGKMVVSVIKGHTIKQRKYSVTPSGKRDATETKRFYHNQAPAMKLGLGVG